MADSLLARLSRQVVRHRRVVVALWLGAAAAFAPVAGRVQQELEVAPSVRRSEAAAVDNAMAARFGSAFVRSAVLVAAGVPTPETPEGRLALTNLIASIDTIGGVTGHVSYLTFGDTLFRGPGRGTFIVVGLENTKSADEIVPRLRAATTAIGAELSRRYGATLRWTGSAAVDHDIRVASASEARSAELRVLPLTLLLLLLAFGAVVASLLPLITAAIAIVIALGLAVLINAVWPLSILLQNMTTMIGLGAGIDYALLTVSRFRESRAAGRNPEEAAADAAYFAGRTIILSGAAVIIGLGALLLIPFTELQSSGVGGILVVAVSVALSTTFLPAVLAMLGARVDTGRVLRLAGGFAPASLWRAWGNMVVRRPLLVLVVSAAPLVALTWQARRLDARFPSGNWLPPRIEAGEAIADLNAMRRGGVVNTVRVLVELPPTSCVFSSAGWQALRRATGHLEADARLMRVASITSGVPGAVPADAAEVLLPARVKRSLISLDGCATVIELIPRDSLDMNGITAVVRDLRTPALAAALGLEGAIVRVGGTAAVNADNEVAIAARAPRIIASVVGLTLLALMVGFRSVFVPVKAVALNLLSIGAAFGAVVLVFHDGWGHKLVGLDGPLSGVFPAIPILVFCVVFGLSMDYEVFLVARVAEARRHLPEREAIVEGLQRTGGVITSAAAIMIVVFGAFALGSFFFIKVLGFALAVAVFVDATIVRLAVGPALLTLAGRWNWWPGDRSSPRDRADRAG
jgi:RND superfamily putative drug exporter